MFIVFFVVILQIGGRSETMFQHNTNQVKEEDSKQIHKQNEVVFELASGTTITEVKHIFHTKEKPELNAVCPKPFLDSKEDSSCIYCGQKFIVGIVSRVI